MSNYSEVTSNNNNNNINEDDSPLTLDIMKSSLSVIAHNAAGQLIYAQSNLNSWGLTSIELLSKYKHLQRISLDNNNLTSLKPLSGLHFLVYLSAANNKLSNDVFISLAGSGTTLERLNLSGNCISSLKGLENLPFLIDFICSHNNIHELCENDFANLHSLTRLNLKYNSIQRIPLNTFIKCSTVRSLDISHNAIANAQFVMHLASNLDTLILEHNYIESLLGFEVLQEVVNLHLAFNHIKSWDELEILSVLVNLRELTLEANPIFQTITIPSTNSILREFHKSKVAHDMDFTKTKIQTTPNINPLSNVNFTFTELSTIAAPPARILVHHLPAAPQEVEAWDIDEEDENNNNNNNNNNNHYLQELTQLPPSLQHRYHVISILRQLLVLDSVLVTPEEIPRAVRLFKKKRGRKTNNNSNNNDNVYYVGSLPRVSEC